MITMKQKPSITIVIDYETNILNSLWVLLAKAAFLVGSTDHGFGLLSNLQNKRIKLIS